MKIFIFGLLFDDKCSTLKNMTKQQICAHCTPTHIHAEDTKYMHHSIMCFKSQVFTTRMVRSSEDSSPSKKWQTKAWATRRCRPRWVCRSRRRSGGCRSSRTASRRSKTQRKTRHQHAFDTPWHFPQTQTTHFLLLVVSLIIKMPGARVQFQKPENRPGDLVLTVQEMLETTV